MTERRIAKQRHRAREHTMMIPGNRFRRFAAALAILLGGCGGVVPVEPPKSLGDLTLLHATQGDEALREIDRLHGKQVGGKAGYVAHYENSGGAAMLYLAQASSRAQAAHQVELMSQRIRKGEGPFYHLKMSRRGDVTLYSALGQGQVHYFYRRDASVFWLAADAPVASQALAALVGKP